LGELADGGGLAAAIDADDEDDEGLPCRIERERPLDGLQTLDDAFGERRADLLGGRLLVEARAPQAIGDALRRAEAEIGADQQLFEFLERGIVELALGDDRDDAVAEALRRALQPGFQPGEKAGPVFAHNSAPSIASAPAATSLKAATEPTAASPEKRTGAQCSLRPKPGRSISTCATLPMRPAGTRAAGAPARGLKGKTWR